MVDRFHSQRHALDHFGRQRGPSVTGFESDNVRPQGCNGLQW